MRKRQKPTVQPDPDVSHGVPGAASPNGAGGVPDTTSANGAGVVPDAAGELTPAKKRSWDWHLIIGGSGEHGKVHKRWLTGVFASAARYGAKVERLDDDEAQDIAAKVTYKLHQKRKKVQTLLNGSVDIEKLVQKCVRWRIADKERIKRHRPDNVRLADDVLVDAEVNWTKPASSENEAVLRDLLQRFLDELPEQRRRVFVMCRVKQLNNEEMAELLGVSEKTIKNHLTAANKQLYEFKLKHRMIEEESSAAGANGEGRKRRITFPNLFRVIQRLKRKAEAQ